MKFNPVSSRIRMLERDGTSPKNMLEYFLATEYDGSRPMGNVAWHKVNDIIKLWLLGLYDEATPMLPKVTNWLNLAIDSGEDFGMHRNFHRYNLRSGLALARWLENGDAAVDDCQIARQIAESNLTDNVYLKNKIKTDGLDDYLSICIPSEEYEVGIIEFEKYHGEKAFSLKKTLSPREFGYFVCQNQLNQKIDPNDLILSGRKMLQGYLDEIWLGKGQYYRAAIWLKNVYWHQDKSLTPLETILKAYDNMPNVQKPDFV